MASHFRSPLKACAPGTTSPSPGAKARCLLAAALVLFAARSVHADVLNLGGIRNPATGTWTGLASLETVPVGNPGNTAGPGGYGSVAYAYNVGKYDVTAGQYTAFLNAVAASDTYGLYNANMALDAAGCQIQRTLTAAGYTYSVSPTYANRPVNYVSFGDAMRFANWLQNGQPTGAQDLTTTEDGAYFVNGATTNADYVAITRKTSWQWAVTSEDEWYKAAYYDGTSGVYNLYATGGNSITTAMANYAGSVGQPTDVGSYLYASPYGTFDQSGNVNEWIEPISSGNFPRLRGGTYDDPMDSVAATFRGISGPSDSGALVGFRVSEVPEPATISLLALAGLGALISRRSLLT